MFENLKEILTHLPVSSIAGQVAHRFHLGDVPIVTSEAASGKTLLIPVACADATNAIVYILEPTRNLAMAAAEALIGLLEGDPDNLIGYLNSNRSGEESRVHHNNRLVFTTVGYALSAGIVSNEAFFILDEAHETSIDLSLTKAIIHKRRESGDQVHLAILSTTIDLDSEVKLWGGSSCHFTCESNTFPVTMVHHPDQSIEASVSYLIEEEAKRGILVFVSGKAESEEVKTKIITHLGQCGFTHGLDFEINTIHGDTPSEEYDLATAAQTRNIKILIGTDVLESGTPLPWVDSGVSSGETKVLRIKQNIRTVEAEGLPSWRVRQQASRTSEYRESTFILCDKVPVQNRPQFTRPDIVRLPSTELVMRAARLDNLVFDELKFTLKEQPDADKLQKAIISLEAYGFIALNQDGSVSLTADGKLIENLPLSHRAAAAYCEAYLLDSVSTMLPLIALMDIGDLRHDRRIPLGGSAFNESDLIHQLCAIAEMMKLKVDSKIAFKDIAESHNLSLKRYREFTKHLTTLENRTETKASFKLFRLENEEERKLMTRLAKRIIFRAMVDSNYQFSSVRGGVKYGIEDYHIARLSNASKCLEYSPYDIFLVTGSLRTISPKNNTSFTVIENVTIFTHDDIPELMSRFGSVVVDPQQRFLKDTERKTQDAGRPIYRSSMLGRAARESNHLQIPVRSEPPRPMPGSFGDLLQIALVSKK